MATAAPAATATERVAIFDLGPAPADATARTAIAAAVLAGGLDPVRGDGAEDALAGIAADDDGAQLAAAVDRAAQAFGALDCTATTLAATTAIGIGAARQAAGLPTPDLARAWTYTLLCADRGNDVDGAMTAAARLRVLGAGSAIEVPAAVWAKYPDVDVLSNRDIFDVKITADVAGAVIWIDHVRAGVSPLELALAAGPHVLAAATPDGRRGWAAGTAIRKQPQIAIATVAHGGMWSGLAKRVAGWHGARPSPAELAAALTEIHARVAILRSGDAIEAWGRVGASDAPHAIGGEHALRRLAAAPALVALIVDRVKTWAEHAPDPDQVLLVETPVERASHNGLRDLPTKWWVYAAVAGVIGTGVALVLIHDHQSDTQTIEVHYP